jgi:hypothetical protein
VNGLERTAARCDVGDHHGAKGVVRPNLYRKRKKGKKKKKKRKNQKFTENVAHHCADDVVSVNSSVLHV